MTEARKTRPIRLTDAEWEKFKRIGGPTWLRDRIKQAKELGNAKN